MFTAERLVYGLLSEDPIEGPLTVDQARRIDWLVQRWFDDEAYKAASKSGRLQCRPEFTVIEDIDLDHSKFEKLCEFRREVEQIDRKKWWVVETKGREHFCPGYYTCLACYPD